MEFLKYLKILLLLLLLPLKANQPNKLRFTKRVSFYWKCDPLNDSLGQAVGREEKQIKNGRRKNTFCPNKPN